MVKKRKVISQNTGRNFHFEQYALTLLIDNRPMRHVVVAIILRQSHKDGEPFWEKLLTLLATLLTWSFSGNGLFRNDFAAFVHNAETPQFVVHAQ